MKRHLPELRCAGALALAFACGSALAQGKPNASANRPAATPSNQKIEETKERLTALPTSQNLRPHGPVQVTADRTEMTQGSSVVLSGHAVLDSDTLKLDGDRLDLKQYPDRQLEAKITGQPAHMAHASVAPDDPAVSAHARTITYDSRSGIVDLIGNAFLDRAGDTTTAETIRYNVAEKRIQESGGGNGRVTIILQPPPDANAPASAAPAPTSPPTATPAPATKPASAPTTRPAPSADKKQ